MIVKILMLVLALLGYYFSPYGPNHSSNATTSQADMAKVMRVIDGDTLTVQNHHGATQKIRLHAIDAPELKQTGGEQSREWLTQQVLNKNVKIVISNTDRYKRQVAKVVLIDTNGEEEIDINLRAIEAGQAWWYREFARSQSASDQILYENAENKAREQRLGLWQKNTPQPPWQWRTEQRSPH